MEKVKSEVFFLMLGFCGFFLDTGKCRYSKSTWLFKFGMPRPIFLPNKTEFSTPTFLGQGRRSENRRQRAGNLLQTLMAKNCILQSSSQNQHPAPKACAPKNRGTTNIPLLKDINELTKTAISFYPYLVRFIWIYFV
jgi:hypothetical protein